MEPLTGGVIHDGESLVTLTEEINQTPPHLPGRPPSWEELDTHLTFLISITERKTKSPSSKGTPKRRLQEATYS